MKTIDQLRQRITRGRKAIALAKKEGMDSSLWEQRLTKLEQAVQEKFEEANQAAQASAEVLDKHGWCLWKCEALDGEVIAVAEDGDAEGMPNGIPVYTVAELQELFGRDKPINQVNLRLIHEAKKQGAVIVKNQCTSEV